MQNSVLIRYELQVIIVWIAMNIYADIQCLYNAGYICL